MMARLLSEEALAPRTPSHEGMCETSKPQNVSLRKLSFKTKQLSARGNYRATKVSLSSSNVALIASKFNTIVIDDAAQGRALLRKLSSNQRKPSSAKDVKSRLVKVNGESVVKAAIQIFEPNTDNMKNGSNKPILKKDFRPKLVVVRKSSSKSSAKSDSSSKSEFSNLDQVSKENAKDCNHIRSKDTIEQMKEVIRKPSLKAKPSLRQMMAKRQTTANTLNQRIAKFNSVSGSRNSTGLPTSTQETRLSTFNLSDRIAQFSQNSEVKSVDNNKKSGTNVSQPVIENKLNRHSLVKENSHEITKSILRNNKNKQSNLVAQTKGRLTAIVEHK